MAISILPNQSLGFNISDACGCGGSYCQPIQTTDKAMIQGYVDVATQEQLLIQGDFSASTNWTLGAGWSISGGKLHATNISGTTATSIAKLSLNTVKLYLIQASITVTSVGSAGTSQGFIIKVNGQSLTLPTATAYNGNLVGTWLYSPGAISSDVVEFSTNESTIDFDVNYFRIYELSQVGLALFNSNGTLEDDIYSFTGANSLKYYYNGEYFTGTSILNVGATAISGNVVMFEMYLDTWSSITDYTGCLTARIYDTTFWQNRVRNPNFSDGSSCWTLSAGIDGGWSISSNKACYASAGAIAPLYQSVELLGGIDYNLDFVLSGNTGGESVVVTYTVDGGSPITATYSSGYLLDLTAYTGIVTVVFYINVGTATDTLCVDTFTLKAIEYDSFNVSACIKLATTHECTLLLYAYNADNAFGFDYASGALRHYLRINAKVDVIGFPEEKDEYRFSDNSRSLLFAMSETEYEVKVGDAPDYIHACIRMMRLNDSFYIDGSTYVVSSDYGLRKRKSSKLGQATFSVKETNQISSNYSCT